MVRQRGERVAGRPAVCSTSTRAIRSGWWSRRLHLFAPLSFPATVEVGIGVDQLGTSSVTLPDRRVRRRRSRGRGAGPFHPCLCRPRHAAARCRCPTRWRETLDDCLALSRAFAAAYSLRQPVDEVGGRHDLVDHADALARSPDVAPRLGAARGLEVHRVGAGARRACRGRARRRRSTRANNCR